MILKNKIIIFFILALAFATHVKAKSICMKATIAEKAKDINQKIYNSIEYSDCLVTYNKIDKDFHFIISLINLGIEKYGIDSLYTNFCYLLLARHYLIIGKVEETNDLLLFIRENGENSMDKAEPQLLQNIYFLEGWIYEFKEEYEKATSSYKKALKLSNKDIILTINILNRLANAYIELSRQNEALKYIDKAVQYRIKIQKEKVRDEKIDTIMIFAKIYEKRKDYQRAGEILYDGIKPYLQERDIYFPKMIEMLTQYAWNLLRTDNYVASIFSSKLSLEIQKKINIKNSPFAVANFFCIGFSEHILKHYEKSKTAYQSALNILNYVHISKKKREQFRIDIEKELNMIDRSKLNKNN